MKIMTNAVLLTSLCLAFLAPGSARADSDPVLWAENVGTGCLVGAAGGALIAAHNYASPTRGAVAGCAVVGTVAGLTELKMLNPGYTQYEDEMALKNSDSRDDE